MIPKGLFTYDNSSFLFFFISEVVSLRGFQTLTSFLSIQGLNYMKGNDTMTTEKDYWEDEL